LIKTAQSIVIGSQQKVFQTPRLPSATDFLQSPKKSAKLNQFVVHHSEIILV